MRSSYYDEELDYIRRLAQEFGASHPEAGHLAVPGQDPDVERLLEGFAFLAAQVRETLDDDFPQLTHGLFGMLWPNYLRPVPSLAIEQFVPRAGVIRQSTPVPRGSEVVSDEKGSAQRYRFQTCWDVMLHPIELRNAALEVMRNGDSSLLLTFALQNNAKFDSLELDSLRLFLHGDTLQTRQLYHHVLRHTREVIAWGDLVSEPVSLDVGAVGMRREDAVLPCPDGVPDGYRLLQEYFVFRDKFGFVDLLELDRLRGERVKSEFNVRIVFDTELSRTVRVATQDVALFCTPVINLFAHAADPLPIDGTRSQYPIRAQGRDQSRIDIYSVDALSVRGEDRKDRPVPSFYSFAPDVFRTSPAYFTAMRRLTPDRKAFQTYLSFVDASGRARTPDEGLANIELTCTNGRSAGSLETGRLCRSSESSPTTAEFRNLTPATPQLEPPQRIGHLWRLLSLMSLNHLTFASPDALRMALELMAVINAGTPGDSERNVLVGGQQETAADIQQRIRGIRGVRSRPIERMYRGGLIRGRQVEIQIDLNAFGGALGQLFLFGSVLDEFLASHASINTFTQLSIKYDDGHVPLAWEPRLGRDRL